MDTFLRHLHFDAASTTHRTSRPLTATAATRTHTHTHTHTQGRPQDFFQGGHRWWKGSVVGGTMASAEHKHITGVWGQSPRGVQGQSPDLKRILVIRCPAEPANLAPFQKCICISTLRATVMIWEKFMSKSRGGGQVTPLAPSWGRPCTYRVQTCYASAVLAMTLCLCLSVCLSVTSWSLSETTERVGLGVGMAVSFHLSFPGRVLWEATEPG